MYEATAVGRAGPSSRSAYRIQTLCVAAGPRSPHHEPARVHGCVRIEGRLDPFGDGPVGPRLAPDAQALLPRRSGTATRIRLPPSRTARSRNFSICPRDLFERPFALSVGADDPVARVCLRRPSVRVEGLDERRDRRRTKIRHEADGPALRRLEAGERLPQRDASLALEDAMSVRPSSLFSRSICQRTEPALSS